MKRLIAITLILLLILPFGSCKNGSQFGSYDSGLHSVNSRGEIIDVIKNFGARNSNADYLFRSAENSIADTAPSTDGSATFSKTNTQVKGVDEGDIVKVDGDSIYKLSQNGFVIVNVDKGEMQIACKITRENYVPLEMYVLDDYLIMIGGLYDYFSYYGARSIEPAVYCCMWIPYSKTEIAVYNIANKQNPTLERSITIDGSFITSRLIGDKIYYVLDYHFYYGNTDGYIPKIADSLNGNSAEMSYKDIYYFNNIPMFSYLILGYIDLTDGKSASKAYLGANGQIYVNKENIFVASNDYSECYGDSFDYSKAVTRILKFSVDSLKFKSAGKVGGTIKDRYSMDEYNGFLRVATTTSWWNTRSNSFNSLFVLNSDMRVVGKIDKFARDETIYSVKFNKDKCTIVTFEMVDPLFTIDLSDPNNPTIISELKEDGVSYYLHYVDDSDLIIGLGVDSEVVNGRVTWKGLKVSLYKESAGGTINLHTVTIGSAWSYAEAMHNARAILADFENYNLFGFAAEVWDCASVDDYYSYQLINQAFYVFTIDPVNECFNYCALSNFAHGLSYSYADDYSDWYSWYDNQFSYIKRGVAIGDYIYTISDKLITSYSISGFVKAHQIQIADFISASELFN